MAKRPLKVVKSPARVERNGGAARATGRGLVIVESPTKVKTIQKYLNGRFVVKASMGHVRDLPKSQLGVDPKKNFKPKYVVSPLKKKVLDDLKKAAEKATDLYVATDPDREGEAIGWHLTQELSFDTVTRLLAWQKEGPIALAQIIFGPDVLVRSRCFIAQERRRLGPGRKPRCDSGAVRAGPACAIRPASRPTATVSRRRR